MTEWNGVLALVGLVLGGIVTPILLVALLYSGKIGTPQKDRGSEYYEKRAEDYWRKHND